MNYIAYLKTFAWISIVALCCLIFSTLWLPMLLGAVMVTVIYRLIK